MKLLRTLAILTALLLTVSGCASSGLRGLVEEYTTVWGTLAAPPTLDGKRLFLYIRVAPKEEGGEPSILVCVTENREKEAILARLADSLVRASEFPDKPIALIGEPVHDEWQEFAEGIDFEVYAAGYYNPSAQKYQTVITTYGTKATDLLSSISWSSFLQTIGKKGIDAAL